MLGKDSYSQSNVDNVDIGAFCSIAGGVKFHADDNHACIYDRNLVSTYPFRERWEMDYPQSCGEKRTVIGNDVWICEGASILPGLTICDGAIVGAHSVVVKDVPAYAVVVGNPAKIKRYRFTKPQIRKLLKIKWWDWDNKLIHERMTDFKDVKTFIKKYAN